MPQGVGGRGSRAKDPVRRKEPRPQPESESGWIRRIHFARQGALGLLLNLGTVVRMMCGHEMTAHPQLGHCRRTFEKRVPDARACSLNARACSFEKGVLERRRKGAVAACSLSLFVQGAPWTPRRCGSERKLEWCCAGCVHTTHTTASRAPALGFSHPPLPG